MDAERNPLVNPQPGDWLSNGKVDVRVDAVADGWVYLMRFRRGDDIGDPFRMEPMMYRRQAAAEGACPLVAKKGDGDAT